MKLQDSEMIFSTMMENHKKRQYELLCSSTQIKGSFHLNAN